MRNKEQESSTWNECSWNKFNIKGRKYWYDEDLGNSFCFFDGIMNYGLIEDINISNCFGIEDWFNIREEYN